MPLLFGSLLVFLIIGVPIAYALGLSSLAYFVFLNPDLIVVVPQRVFSGMNNYALIALPLFILMGQVMNSSGITARLIDMPMLLLGRLRGGLGLVNISASMIFGGISGSSTSDTASIGAVMIPEMRRRGYSAKFAAGITVASSTMGMIIPPSVPIVLYAIVAQESVGRLFAADGDHVQHCLSKGLSSRGKASACGAAIAENGELSGHSCNACRGRRLRCIRYRHGN